MGTPRRIDGTEGMLGKLRMSRESLSSKTRDIFDEACLTTVVTIGPPPPTPNWHVGLTIHTYKAIQVRSAWCDEVERLVTRRYGMSLENVGAFILALDAWWLIKKEEMENARENDDQS